MSDLHHVNDALSLISLTTERFEATLREPLSARERRPLRDQIAPLAHALLSYLKDQGDLPLDIQSNLLRNTSAMITLLRDCGTESEGIITALVQGRDDIAVSQERLISPYRELLRRGELRGDSLRTLLENHATHDPTSVMGWSLDSADTFFDLLLDLPSVASTSTERLSEMLFYKPTSVSALLALLDRLALTEHDTFCDLGAGISRVPILISLLTDAKCLGVEYCESLHLVALDLVAKNTLPRVEPIHDDARRFDLARANVFYLFNPFEGELLATVLRRMADRLHTRDASRVTIASLGVCSEAIDSELGHLLQESTDPAVGTLGMRIFTSTR